MVSSVPFRLITIVFEEPGKTLEAAASKSSKATIMMGVLSRACDGFGFYTTLDYIAWFSNGLVTKNSTLGLVVLVLKFVRNQQYCCFHTALVFL